MAAPLVLLAALPALGAAAGSLRGPPLKTAWWMPPRPQDTGCLNYYPAGCYRIQDQTTCLSSKDGRDRVEWSGLKIYGEPCVWCGGRPCHDNNTNLCEPYDFLYHGEGVGFSAFLNHTSFQVSQCGPNGLPVPVPVAVAAAVAASVKPTACSAYTGCAGQGLQGACCPNEQNLTLDCCASSLTASAAAAAASAAAAQHLGATPVDKVTLPAPLAPVVANDSWWQTPQPTSEAQTSCLMHHLFGCHVIVHSETCLGSQDARKNASWYGLQITGQPCVWCGGLPCRSGSTNLCEPLDFLMRGEGVAFRTFFAKSDYQVATCVDGHPAPPKRIFRHPPYPTLPPLPPFPTLAPWQWWAPEKPSEAGLTCLKSYAQGCSAIQDMATCVSSRDGRPVASQNGLKIQGEPCVWCGGGPCHTNSSSLCEPFDYVMHGEGDAFGLFVAKFGFTVANCNITQDFKLAEDYDMDCLEAVNSGCSAVNDAASCLSMMDNSSQATVAGLKKQGQPCVWCGGLPCTSNGANKCEPFDYVINGEGRAYSHFYSQNTYRVAGCKNGRPSAASLHAFSDTIPGLIADLGGPPPLVPFWVAHKPTGNETKCLKPASYGCRALVDMEKCMTSYDASGVASHMGLKVDSEPCVWCGGGACTTNSTNLCEPFDFVMYGENSAFDSFLAKGIYKVAECLPPLVQLPPYSYSCLVETGPGGCSSNWDAETCLRSKDGSPTKAIGNLQVRGQPCVWCGGGACHSGKNALCEAFDFVLNGESQAFQTFNAPESFRMAACQNGLPHAATLTNFTDFVPGWTSQPKVPVYNASWWKTNQPAKDELGCLMNHRYGCAQVGHEQTCLGSKDARSQADFGPAVQVEGQPCVWCGGAPCISGDMALCQPFDLIMKGEGTNFTTFFAKNHYQVARCVNGVPQPPTPTLTSPAVYFAPAPSGPFGGFEALPAGGSPSPAPLAAVARSAAGAAGADAAVAAVAAAAAGSTSAADAEAAAASLSASATATAPPVVATGTAAPAEPAAGSVTSAPVAPLAPVATAAPLATGAPSATGTAAPAEPAAGSVTSAPVATLAPVATAAPLATAAPSATGTAAPAEPAAGSVTSAPVATASGTLAPIATGTLGPLATLPPIELPDGGTLPPIPVAAAAGAVAAAGAAAAGGTPPVLGAPPTMGPPAALGTVAPPGVTAAPTATAAPGTAAAGEAAAAGSGTAAPAGATAPPSTLGPLTVPPLPSLAPLSTAAPEAAAAGSGTAAPAGAAAPPGTLGPLTLPPLPSLAPLTTQATSDPTATLAPPDTVPALAPVGFSVRGSSGGVSGNFDITTARPASPIGFSVRGSSGGVSGNFDITTASPTSPLNPAFPASPASPALPEGTEGTEGTDGTEGTEGGVAFRNAGANATNGTAALVAGQSSGGSSVWMWAIGGTALVGGIAAVPWLMGRFGGKQKGAKKGKRGVKAPQDGEIASRSFDVSQAELEMSQPLVQPEGNDLFDQIDRDHDGVISSSEFNAAMGFPQPAAAAQAAPVASHRGMSMAAATAAVAPVSSMIGQVPLGVMAAPVATTATQQPFAVPVAAAQQPFAAPMAAPAATMRPSMVAVPQGAGMQYLQGAPPPPGVPLVGQAHVSPNRPVYFNGP